MSVNNNAFVILTKSSIILSGTQKLKYILPVCPSLDSIQLLEIMERYRNKSLDGTGYFNVPLRSIYTPLSSYFIIYLNINATLFASVAADSFTILFFVSNLPSIRENYQIVRV